MSNNQTPLQQKLWSEFRGLAELADLIDALPPMFRTPILNATISFTPTGDFECSYIVGTIRSKLFDCVLDFCGVRLDSTTAAHLEFTGWATRLSSVAAATCPTKVQLAICDLLQFIAGSVKEEQGHDR